MNPTKSSISLRPRSCLIHLPGGADGNGQSGNGATMGSNYLEGENDQLVEGLSGKVSALRSVWQPISTAFHVRLMRTRR